MVAEKGQDKKDAARTFCLEGCEEMLPLLGLVLFLEPKGDTFSKTEGCLRETKEI